LRTLATARSPPNAADSDRDAFEPYELQLVLDPEFLYSRPQTGVGLMGTKGAHRSGGGNSRIAKRRKPILVKTARFSFARALLNCSERSAGSHGLDRSKSRPDCPVTWPNRRKGSRKPVHPVREVSVLGLESLSFTCLVPPTFPRHIGLPLHEELTLFSERPRFAGKYRPRELRNPSIFTSGSIFPKCHKKWSVGGTCDGFMADWTKFGTRTWVGRIL